MQKNLTEAAQGIHVSSQAIFKNNQRHLFCSALDLLASSWNTSKSSEIETINTNIMQLLQDIVNMVFDKDQSIQSSAIITLESGISTFGIKAIQNNPMWGRFRNAIITNYAQQINKLLNDGNRRWSEIWCLLIRLLDSEILRGASTINTFLSILELGFRSSDNLIRTESFTCWRLLIKIFTTYNEISSAKRMKLIAIPLKSTQSKTFSTAEEKLRVWWYLITCLKDCVSNYVVTVLEPFFIFCFGSSSKSVLGAAQQYDIVRQIALPCLVKSLSSKPNDFLDRCLKELKLELLPMPSPLISMNFLNEHWSLILNTSCEAIRLYTKQNDESSDNEHRMIEMILRILVDIMLKLDSRNFNTQFCTELKHMMAYNPRSVVFVINIFSSNDLQPFQHFDNYAKSLTELLFDAKHLLPPAILQRSIANLYRLDNLKTFKNELECVNVIFDILTEFQDKNDDGFAVLQFNIWSYVTNALFEFEPTSNCIEHRISIKKWILWPVQNYLNIQRKHTSVYLEEYFFKKWEELLIIETSCNDNSRRILFTELNNILQESFKLKIYDNCMELFLEAYVHAAISFIGDMQILRDLFSLLLNLFEYQSNAKAALNINILQNILTEIKADQIELLFNEIKSVLLCAINAISNSNSDILRDLKSLLFEKLRSCSTQNTLSKIKDIFKEKDSFVIIPSVWSLNPEKLTERQKERLAEKSVIPALYNDMSQSQDKQIQPWTPNKIIIARIDQKEIAIMDRSEKNKHSDDNETEQESNQLQKTQHAQDNEDRNEIYTRTRKALHTSQLIDATAAHEGELYEPSCQFKNSEQKYNFGKIEETESTKLNSDIIKELSPKKHIAKPISLSSPPDRKLTNNSSSPTIRPKPPTGHLTGRGAQLINMIRNKRNDTFSQSTPNLKTTSSENRPGLELMESNGNENIDNRDLLIFSKSLPSPSASPSASILKRKMCLENVEDICTDSPTAKRKRVSFHDPPVSTTKAYFKEIQESKIKTKRCLLLDKYATKQGSESKNSLKRRSKLDSLNEIYKLSSDEIGKVKSNSDVEEDTSKNDANDDMSESLNLQVDCDDRKDLTSIDPDVLLHFVSQQFSLTEVLEKYFSVECDPIQNSKLLAKFLSSVMTKPKIKFSALEILSENHSKDFLDHAVQENLSSVVCDRLNLNSVIDFVCAKSVINLNCRTNLMSHITELFKNNKLESESVNFIDNLLKTCKFNDEIILKFISTLVNKRFGSDGTAGNVSESAVDSSSNL